MILLKDKISYNKLLNIKSCTGLALFKSLATHVWDFAFKIKSGLTLARDMAKNVGTQETLSQSSRSYVPFGNLGCLAKSFLYSCQISSQTLMKKVLYVLFFSVLMFPALSYAGFPANQRTLYNGSWGEDVKALQIFLASQGFYTSSLDGKFGDLTEQGVRQFQSTYGIVPISGDFEPETRAKANSLMSIEPAVIVNKTTEQLLTEENTKLKAQIEQLKNMCTIGQLQEFNNTLMNTNQETHPTGEIIPLGNSGSDTKPVVKPQPVGGGTAVIANATVEGA